MNVGNQSERPFDLQFGPRKLSFIRHPANVTIGLSSSRRVGSCQVETEPGTAGEVRSERNLVP